jgi:hypothetical protein
MEVYVKTQRKGLHMVCIGDMAVAELHGSQICTFNRRERLLMIGHFGWPTASTAKAINAFFERYEIRGRAYKRGENVYVDIEGCCKEFTLAASPAILDLDEYQIPECTVYWPTKKDGLEVGNG